MKEELSLSSKYVLFKLFKLFQFRAAVCVVWCRTFRVKVNDNEEPKYMLYSICSISYR